MNKALIDIYLDYVNNYLTIDSWSEDHGISKKSGQAIIEALATDYNDCSDLVGLQRTRRADGE